MNNTKAENEIIISVPDVIADQNLNNFLAGMLITLVLTEKKLDRIGIIEETALLLPHVQLQRDNTVIPTPVFGRAHDAFIVKALQTGYRSGEFTVTGDMYRIGEKVERY
ncbi:MAG: hypothetical protein ABI758_06260 [Candidatus Woesebacteria bacterium]